MIIDARGLAKRFRGHAAVCDATLQVPEGAAVALIGANGAGKTTTLRLLANILTPDAGSASILGVESRRLSASEWQRMAYVSESQTLPERLKVGHYFDYLRCLYTHWDVALERTLRRQFVLPAGRPLGKLSHGMRVKTMLAAALSFRPELLILDEPLSGLDALVRDDVMGGLLGQAGDTTILLSSHELSEIEHGITHVAFMHNGRVMFQDSVEALASRFREVLVTFEAEASIRGAYPDSWLQPTLDGQTLRFVDTAFAGLEELQLAVRRCGGPVRRVEARGVSLRDIATGLMRATQTDSQA